MNTIRKLHVAIPVIALLCGAGLLSARETVALRTQPEVSLPPVFHISANDPSLREAVPVDGSGGDAWSRVERTGRFTGYVRNEDIGKGAQLSPGVSVFARPDESAPVLTTIEEGDEADIVWSGNWNEIAFTKTLTLYFKGSPLAGANRTGSETTTARPSQRAAEAHARPAPSASSYEGERAKSETTHSGPASAAEASQVSGSPVSSTAEIEDMETAAPVHRRFEGYLERSRPRITLIRHPFPYQLTTADGSRLAYLDPRELILSVPIEELADNWVTVHGSIYEISRGRNLVIHALQLRLK